MHRQFLPQPDGRRLDAALKGDRIDAYSAGVEPHGVDPRAVKVMAEVGVDISGQSSKHVDTLEGIEFDYVITLCDQANESCPFFPGKTRRLHMGFDDPPKLAAGAPPKRRPCRITGACETRSRHSWKNFPKCWRKNSEQ